ncbi:MAG: anthranilate synthase component I family protein [Deltaproteobacteria bacterium]|jgi:anthranilate synthase component 1|nr:anthranilate synthase component I family protein [Deltaproteobacteria bacterium]
MITLTQKARQLESDLLTPISLFMEKVGTKGAGILLESAEIGGRWGRYSVLAAGILMKLKVKDGFLEVETKVPALAPLKGHSGLPFFMGLQKVLSSLEVEPDPKALGLPSITRGLYGYLGYGLVSLIEPHLAPLVPASQAESIFVLPEKVFLFDHAYGRVTELALEGPALEEDLKIVSPQLNGGYKVTPSMEEHMDKVREAKKLIGEGELIQLVLSVGYEAPYMGPPLDLYRALRLLNPSPYMFHMQFPELSLVVSSPEVLVSCTGGELRLCPIAGTRPRGANEEEDNLFEVELVNNFKEQAEHVMLVDLGRNDLGKVAQAGSVTVERFMDVERFSHVMHLTSQLKAKLKENLDALDVVKATFPAGTVSGAPKIRAMELIAKMEKGPRGPYAGAIGWFGLDKGSVDLDFGITIRAAWIRDGKVNFRAGGGLVYDSDPYDEWRECQNKAEAIRQALLHCGQKL